MKEIPKPSFELSFATPRKLPKIRDLNGNVVVLDIAFASQAGGHSFESVTRPFIDALGARLKAWIDHHDSIHQEIYKNDPRFILSTKAEHPACPEMVTPELVKRIGQVNTIVCHGDFDGLASAAKWMRGGEEPYPGCDADARAIDTRMGVPGPLAERIDWAIRARPRDNALLGLIVRHLAAGLSDASLWQPIDDAGAHFAAIEAEARRLASGYEVFAPGLAVLDCSKKERPYDKTSLLLLGQERAPMAAVIDGDNVTFAARFDSGINFLDLFGISGGMPTVVSIQKTKLEAALISLGLKSDAIRKIIQSSNT